MVKSGFLLLSAVLFHYSYQAFMKNKYEIEMKNVQLCPDNDKLRNSIKNLKFSAYNRTHKALSYDITYDRPLDENIGGGMNLERWGDGGWIQIPFLGIQPNICERSMKYFKDTWVDIYKNVGVPHPDRCPIPAGNYSLRNFVVDTSKLNNLIPFWSGQFRVTSFFQDMRTKEIIQCSMYTIEIRELF